MNDFENSVIDFKKRNNLDSEACAKRLGINTEQLSDIENNKTTLSSDEIVRISKIVNGSKVRGKRIVKTLDLIFRLASMIMALVVLLLCINGITDYSVLIVLLSIGLVCSSFTILPKIEK